MGSPWALYVLHQSGALRTNTFMYLPNGYTVSSGFFISFVEHINDWVYMKVPLGRSLGQIKLSDKTSPNTL